MIDERCANLARVTAAEHIDVVVMANGDGRPRQWTRQWGYTGIPSRERSWYGRQDRVAARLRYTVYRRWPAGQEASRTNHQRGDAGSRKASIAVVVHADYNSYPKQSLRRRRDTATILAAPQCRARLYLRQSHKWIQWPRSCHHANAPSSSATPSRGARPIRRSCACTWPASLCRAGDGPRRNAAGG